MSCLPGFLVLTSLGPLNSRVSLTRLSRLSERFVLPSLLRAQLSRCLTRFTRLHRLTHSTHSSTRRRKPRCSQPVVHSEKTTTRPSNSLDCIDSLTPRTPPHEDANGPVAATHTFPVGDGPERNSFHSGLYPLAFLCSGASLLGIGHGVRADRGAYKSSEQLESRTYNNIQATA